MTNRPTDAQRMANQAQQLRDWTSQLRSEDSTVQQLALLRQFVADDGNSDAVEWLLERVLEHTTAAENAAAPAPTDDEILSEFSPRHLDNLLTEAERNQFETKGFFVVKQALPQPLVAKFQGIVEDLEAEYRPRLDITTDQRLNLIDCISKDGRLLELLDYPTVFPKVWGVLGWNIQLYLAQCTVMPPTGTVENTPDRLGWHRDSGRVNQEMQDHGGNPRVSLKIGYILSDTTERTGFQVIPGTHLGAGVRGGMIDLCDGTLWDMRQGDPPGAVSVPLFAGDAVLFDRRVVHAQPHNPLVGEGLRKALFFGYSYRWLRPRDENSGLEKYSLHRIQDLEIKFDRSIELIRTCWSRYLERSGPIRRQLLGAGPTGARGYTSPLPEDVPLRTYMEAHGFGKLRDDDILRTFAADDRTMPRL